MSSAVPSASRYGDSPEMMDTYRNPSKMIRVSNFGGRAGGAVDAMDSFTSERICSLPTTASSKSGRSEGSGSSSLPSYDSASRTSNASAGSRMSLGTRGRLLETMRLAAERAASRRMSGREASALIDAMNTAMDGRGVGKDGGVEDRPSVVESRCEVGGEDCCSVRGEEDGDCRGRESGGEDAKIAAGSEREALGGEMISSDGGDTGGSMSESDTDRSEDSMLTDMADNTVQGLQFQSSSHKANNDTVAVATVADPSNLEHDPSTVEEGDPSAAEASNRPIVGAEERTVEGSTHLDDIDIERSDTNTTEILVNAVRDELSRSAQNFASSLPSYTSVLSIMSVVEEVDDMAVEVRADIHERLVEDGYDEEKVKDAVDEMVREEISALLRTARLSDRKEAKLLSTYEGREDVLIAHLRRLRDMDNDDDEDEEKIEEKCDQEESEEKKEEMEEENGETEEKGGDEPADETSPKNAKSMASVRGDEMSVSSAKSARSAKSSKGAKSTKSAKSSESARSIKSAIEALLLQSSNEAAMDATSVGSAKSKSSAKSTNIVNSAESAKSTKSANSAKSAKNAKSTRSSIKSAIEALLPRNTDEATMLVGEIQTELAKSMAKNSAMVAHKESKLMARYEGREDALIAHLQRLEEDYAKVRVVLEEGKLVKVCDGLDASGGRLDSASGTGGMVGGKRWRSMRGVMAGTGGSNRFSRFSMRSFRRSRQRQQYKRGQGR